jgi:hypothetical protein
LRLGRHPAASVSNGADASVVDWEGKKVPVWAVVPLVILSGVASIEASDFVVV